MLALPLYLFFAGLTIWGFFNVQLAALAFISTIALFVVWLVVASWGLRSHWIRKLDPLTVPPVEMVIFKKYAFYFIYPYQAQQYSSTFSFLQALSLVWLVLLLWKQQWLLVGLIVMAFLAATLMMQYMNPGNFLRFHADRGNLGEDLLERLELIEAVEARITDARRA